jgi:hypothetical protein
MIQRCTITDWHPTMNPNGGTPHRMVQHKRHEIDSGTAWSTAKHAGWTFVPGKVRLTITLVYAVNRLPDKDNAYARCKGVVDGLKLHPSPWLKPRAEFAPDEFLNRPIGFFTDDKPELCELVVEAIVQKGKKETRLVLEVVE